MALKLAQDDHRGEEMDLRKDKRALKVSLKEQELSHEDIIKNLKRVGSNIFFLYFLENLVETISINLKSDILVYSAL